MAKKSMIARELRREKAVLKHAEKRAGLRKVLKDVNASFQEKSVAQFQLQKLPRDSNATRLRNRCAFTGRPHGVYRKFGLGRNKLREASMLGYVPGITKASW